MPLPASEPPPLETPARPREQAKVFTAGTLRYTRYGLCVLFFWMLWGDFIWTLMDAIMPAVMPLLMKNLGFSNTSIQFLNKSLAMAVAFLVCPVIGFQSDRHRGPRGRRIPYLLWSTPFVGFFLVLLGFYKEISRWLVGADGSFLGIGTATMYLLVIAALMLGYDFANTFVNTIYYFLFNDVVPEQFLSRFLSLFRIVGGLAGAAFSYWIFPITLDKARLLPGVDNFTLVAAAAGIVYLFGFMAMCLFVKEGQYAPPPPNIGNRPGLAAAVKTFLKECFSHKFYWCFFISDVCLYMAVQIKGFDSFRNIYSLNMSYQELGDLGALTAVVGMLLQYPAGWLCDKYNPIRVYFALLILNLLQPLAQCLWWFADFGHAGNYRALLLINFTVMPLNVILWAAYQPVGMRLLPRERYGQFASANAALRSVGLIVGATASGLFMDVIVYGWPALGLRGLGDWGYRLYPIWYFVFLIPAIGLFVPVYREWKIRGGERSYTPPAV